MTTGTGARDTTGIDWDAVRDEATRHLQALLRLETVNPPGNEILAAEYLADTVRAEGFEPVVVESEPGRGNFVTRLRAPEPKAPPLMLMGHTDVVSVEADKWTHGPFSGDIDGGEIWGRGAVDMKGQVAAELTTLLLLKRQGVRLDRDIILAAFADEEAGSFLGARWLWDNRRELIDAEYAINEGGGARVEIGGKVFYTCQTSEKGGCRMRIVARGEPGHASVPLDDTAVYRLAHALVRLQRFQGPTILTKTMRRYLESIGRAIGGETEREVQAVLANPTWEALAALPFPEQLKGSLRATTRNTATPTILRGGHRMNVIPSQVECDVDGRILPGQEPADWVAQVQAAVGDGVTVEFLRGGYGLEADPDSPFFDTIAAVMAEEDPGAILVPSIVSGGTDAKGLPGVKVYGFMPSRRGESEFALAHAHDERVRIADLLFATRCFYRIVTRFAGG